MFQFLFHQPLHVMSWLLGLAGILVFYQFFRLAQSIQWSHVLCLALMLFCNFYTVFKLLRDFFIMSKTYRDHDPAANAQWMGLTSERLCKHFCEDNLTNSAQLHERCLKKQWFSCDGLTNKAIPVEAVNCLLKLWTCQWWWLD